MTSRFESICNDIGLLDNETGKKYIYFNKDFVKFINELVMDCNRLDDEKKQLNEEKELLALDNVQLRAKLHSVAVEVRGY